MGRRAIVHRDLTGGPITLAEARAAGVTRSQLRGSSWRRLGPQVYAWTGLPLTPGLVVEAIARRLPRGAAFAGRTAAWLHGHDIQPHDPVQIVLPERGGIQPARAIEVWRGQTPASDLTLVDGKPATRMPRTLCDLALRMTPDELVIRVDHALHLESPTLADLRTWMARNAGRKGIARLRQAVAMADGAAESPFETRLRLSLVRAGLPRPESQVDLVDSRGQFVGRADLYYAEARLVIEYDGAGHRDRLREDNRRQNLILAAGYQILRFTADDVLGRPEAVAGQVWAALRRGHLMATG